MASNYPVTTIGDLGDVASSAQTTLDVLDGKTFRDWRSDKMKEASQWMADTFGIKPSDIGKTISRLDPRVIAMYAMGPPPPGAPPDLLNVIGIAATVTAALAAAGFTYATIKKGKRK